MTVICPFCGTTEVRKLPGAGVVEMYECKNGDIFWLYHD